MNLAAAPNRDRVSPLGPGDFLCLAVILALMLLSCYVHSRNHMFWGDELMGWLVIRDKTFGAMIHNWRLGLDSGSLFYMVGGRLWTSIFTASELSLRMFSATFMAVSLSILWVTARRFYSLTIVALSLPIIYFLNTWAEWQLYNARMYGGFMTAAALTCLAFVMAGERRTSDARLLAITFAGHAFLLASHILGIYYSGMFIAALIAQDLWLRQWRPKLYGSALAGWSVLLISYKNIQSVLASGKPAYWTQKPYLHDLKQGFSVYSHSVQDVVLGAFTLAVLATLFLKPKENRCEAKSRLPIYFIVGTFAVTVFTTYLISKVATSIFFNRYLLPVIIGDALLLCDSLDRIDCRLPPKRALHAALATALGLFSAYVYVYRLRHHYDLPERDYTESFLANDPAGVPMVITDVMTFSEMVFYRNDRALMLMPVDWSINLDPDVGAGGATGPHEMDSWKAAGYFADRILPTQEILARYPRFIVASEPTRNLWFRRYIQGSGKYDIQMLGKAHADDLWLVTARTPQP